MADAGRQTGGMGKVVTAVAVLLLVLLGPAVATCQADGSLYALNIYSGRLTTNNWEDFFAGGDKLNFTNSYLVAVALARRIHSYQKKTSFELEGQLVKHFNRQKHWELNALAVARWEAFCWDETIDTDVAFGLGASYATDKAKIEEQNDGDTSRLLAYWMGELALSLPAYPATALIVRIHHRSDAFGFIADGGGSNALAVGLKYRF